MSAAVTLPKGVHRVTSRGKQYFYFQANRGTPVAGPRIALPSDPHSPEFWAALRQAQGLDIGPAVITFGHVCDLYETSPHVGALSQSTRTQYRKWLAVVRRAWGALPAAGVRPVHVRALLDQLAGSPGMANNVLGGLRAISNWGLERGHFDASLTEGVRPYKVTGGHKPWTEAQCAAAMQHFTGNLRKAFFLARYTGQRGSDVVRLGEGYIDEGGFNIRQQKTGREIWCPIDDALAAEMATWERAPGPYLRQSHGKVYSRKLLDSQFNEARARLPDLAGATFHGLRGTRVVELRRAGLTPLQIQDQIGMSIAMIERYCRFADRKLSGKASVVALAERRKARGE